MVTVDTPVAVIMRGTRRRRSRRWTWYGLALVGLVVVALALSSCSWPTKQAARCDTAHTRYRVAGAVSYVGSGLSGSTALASTFAADEDVQRWVNVGVIVAAAVTIGAVFLRDDYRIAIDRECSP